MNAKLILVILFLLSIVMVSFLSDKTAQKRKIIFFGDSITEMGIEPGGYISVIGEKLQQVGNSSFELIGAGIGGNKVYDLYLRMKDDVLAQKPDVVVVFVGVNDVWHKRLAGTGTDKDKFDRFYRAIVSELQAAGAKVIVCTPAAIGEKRDGKNEMDDDLDAYSDVIRRIAQDEYLPLVDLRTAFMQYEKQYNVNNASQGVLTTDGVHLNAKGNTLVADLICKEIRKIAF